MLLALTVSTFIKSLFSEIIDHMTRSDKRVCMWGGGGGGGQREMNSNISAVKGSGIIKAASCCTHIYYGVSGPYIFASVNFI